MRGALRIAAGVVAGYVVIVILSSGTTAVLRALLEAARAEPPSTPYLVFDIAYSLLYSAVGGWVAVRLGASAISAYVLAAAFFVLGLVTIFTGMDTTHPPLYQWLAAVLAPLAVLAGGRAASRPRDLTPRSS